MIRSLPPPLRRRGVEEPGYVDFFLDITFKNKSLNVQNLHFFKPPLGEI
jgi:hypothetical protein